MQRHERRRPLGEEAREVEAVEVHEVRTRRGEGAPDGGLVGALGRGPGGAIPRAAGRGRREQGARHARVDPGHDQRPVTGARQRPLDEAEDLLRAPDRVRAEGGREGVGDLQHRQRHAASPTPRAAAASRAAASRAAASTASKRPHPFAS